MFVIQLYRLCLVLDNTKIIDNRTLICIKNINKQIVDKNTRKYSPITTIRVRYFEALTGQVMHTRLFNYFL